MCTPQLDHSEMFTELYREEKKEEGDRGGQKDKKGGMKRRETDPASNQFPKCSPPSGTHRNSELGRVEGLGRRHRQPGGEKGESKGRESSQASNLAP